jgi:CheY-like chemotaxis protein
MSDISVHTRVNQAWFTSLVAIISISVLGLILELAMGSKPIDLFSKVSRARNGAEQIRLELVGLGKILSDNPDSYSTDLPKRLTGVKDSLTNGLQQLRQSGLKGENQEAFDQLDSYYSKRFLPDFTNFQRQIGEQDRSMIYARLRVSRSELESRLGILERSLEKFSTGHFQELVQIKLLAGVGGCVLGLFTLGLLWFQVRGLHKAVDVAIQEATPVSAADAKMAENIAKYASRIRELEGSNKTLRSEVDKLAPLADEVVTLRQQVSSSPWETWLTAIHSRARSTLGKGGQLGIVLELRPAEIQELEPALREHTEFIRIEAPSDAEKPVESRHTVLIVDDDILNRNRLQSCISGLNLDVVEAGSTAEAWKLIDGGLVVRLCLVGTRDESGSGSDFAKQVKADPRFQDLEIILCTPMMDTGALTERLETLAASKTPLEEAQEKSGLSSHAYGKMLKAVNTETKETLTFARTALSHGQRNAAWTRITALKETAGNVGDKGFNNAIESVEKEMDRGDVFFITAELERLERENQRLSKLAEQLLTSAPKTMSAEETGSDGGASS